MVYITSHAIYFFLISTVSPEIQDDRSQLIYVCYELCMLSLNFSYMLLDYFCGYQISWLNC